MHSTPFIRLAFLLLSSTLSTTLLKPVAALPVEVLEISEDGVTMQRRTVDDSLLAVGRFDNSTAEWFNEELAPIDAPDVDSDDDEFDEEEEDNNQGSFFSRLMARARAPRRKAAPKNSLTPAARRKKVAAGGAAAPAPPKAIRKKPTPKQTSYILDCRLVPEICSNICFFEKCKGGSTTLTRKAVNGGRTVAPQCAKKPNKCSALFKGSGTAVGGAFSGASVGGMECDEFPLASSTTGGIANAATRCVPARQNSSAGAKFNQVVTGRPVRTVLQNLSSAKFYCDGNCVRPDDADGRQE